MKNEKPTVIIQKPEITNPSKYILYIGRYQEIGEGHEKPSVVVWEENDQLMIKYIDRNYLLIPFEQHQYSVSEGRILDSNSVVFKGFIKNQANLCKIGTHLFSRLYPAEDIVPVLPKDAVSNTMKNALQEAKKQTFSTSELISIKKLKPSVQSYLRFATKNNPLHEILLSFDKPYLEAEAAKALSKVEEDLQKEDLSLFIYQAYIPWYIEKGYFQLIQSMGIEKPYWDIYQKNLFSTACAVDVTLYNHKSQTLVDMGTVYLADTEEANVHYFGGTSYQRYYKNLLYRSMKKYGFELYSERWWGYTFQKNEAMTYFNEIPDQSKEAK